MRGLKYKIVSLALTSNDKYIAAVYHDESAEKNCCNYIVQIVRFRII